MDYANHSVLRTMAQDARSSLHTTGAGTAGQEKILAVVASRTFDFFNTRKIIYLSIIFDLC